MKSNTSGGARCVVRRVVREGGRRGHSTRQASGDWGDDACCGRAVAGAHVAKLAPARATRRIRLVPGANGRRRSVYRRDTILSGLHFATSRMRYGRRTWYPMFCATITYIQLRELHHPTKYIASPRFCSSPKPPARIQRADCCIHHTIQYTRPGQDYL